MNRTITKALRTAVAGLFLLTILAGCNEAAPTAPVSEAPTLPDSDRLGFDFSFFHHSQKTLAADQQNYLNAIIRVAVIQVVTQFVLAPPIAAFALAVHTIPSPQPDGSWLWVYTWVNGSEEVQVRLRGMEAGGGVDWEMRFTALHENPPAMNELWFEGSTRDDGDNGTWTFYDYAIEGKPAVGQIEWDNWQDGSELIYTDLYENPDDELAYRIDGDDYAIEFTDASEGTDWFIRWDDATGAGSLQVPDYNDGEEACWDENQEDIECGPLT